MKIEVSYAYMCNTRRHNIGVGLPIISQHDLLYHSCLLYKRFRISSIILKDRRPSPKKENSNSTQCLS